MLPKVDIAGKIQQLYMQKRPVPYLSFMQVFNDLLADPVKVVPRKPNPDLREKFRAACMAANVGLVDPEGRDAERIREFREKICPVWRDALPPEDMAKFDEILRGTLREQRGAEAYEKTAAAQASSDRSRELLEKLGLAELEVEPPAPVAAAQEAPRGKAPRHFESVDELCGAIRAGDVKPQYLPRGEVGEFARYRIDGLEVAVKLAESNHEHYAVLTASIGRATMPKARERIDDVAAQMGYVRMADYAYMRRDDEFVCTLAVGPTAVNMACKAAEAGPQDDVVRRIERMHRDLGELVERLR
jgi:hypothetical protein